MALSLVTTLIMKTQTPIVKSELISWKDAIIMINNATNEIKSDIDKMSFISKDKVNEFVELIKTAHAKIQ